MSGEKEASVGSVEAPSVPMTREPAALMIFPAVPVAESRKVPPVMAIVEPLPEVFRQAAEPLSRQVATEEKLLLVRSSASTSDST